MRVRVIREPNRDERMALLSDANYRLPRGSRRELIRSMTTKYVSFDRSRLRLKPLIERTHDLHIDHWMQLGEIRRRPSSIQIWWRWNICWKSRARVLQRVKETHYQPNRAARSLVTGRSFTIGLIVPDLEHPFFGEIAKAIARRIRTLDYSLIIASSEEDPVIEHREVEGLIARQVDALVLASVQTSADVAVFQRLADLKIPYVLVDRNFPELHANYVGVDDAAVGRAATEHLIACGCRRIAHLRGPEVSTGVGRLRGYRETLSRHGMDVPVEYVVELKGGDDRSEEHGDEATKRLLSLKVPPDGVFCYNDEVAIGALRAILGAGLRVPDDIAVIGVDNIRFADLLRVPLSSIDQNSYQIGERAARLALKLIESRKPLRSAQIILPVRLVARDSTQARSSFPRGSA